uniref:Uncharacterized protein n=1 Tax=Alexandrium catenella TaxID=2925 RepID=A0A7S1QID6_ALECA|mmetsp:Transcript_31676/g.85872  ORF Transcript_31676/g.85872 Transcript_31676/m.85872 type:complete len:521 (+) Transcript_31676:90-1652(+)
MAKFSILNALLMASSVAVGSAQAPEPCDPDGQCAATSAPGQSAIQRTRERLVAVHAVGEEDAQPSAAAGDATADPIHFLQFDGKTKTPVPRRDVDGFVRELVLRFPLGGQVSGGVSLAEDGGKVYLPFEVMLEADYSRDTPTTGHSDYGLWKGMAMRNTIPSMLSDRIAFGFAEKTHTLYSNIPTENYPSYTKQKARADQADAGYQKTLAENPTMRGMRTFMMNAFMSTGFMMQIQNTGLADTRSLSAIRDFVSSSNGSLTGKERGHIAKAASQLPRRAKLASEKPLRSAPACMHIENSSEIKFVDGGAYITLGVKHVVYRGRLLFSPNSEYDLASGYGVFYHNKAANSVDFYFGGSHMQTLVAVKDGWEANLWVGNADGASWPKAIESRPPSTVAGPEAQGAYAQLQQIPIDYSFLYKDPADVGCPDSRLQEIEADSAAILRTMAKRDMTTITHMTDMVPCLLGFYRPDDEGLNTGYGIMEAIGFLHFVMEIPAHKVWNFLGPHVEWNWVHGVEVNKPN